MRRPFGAMEANAARLPGVNQPGAQALAEFIVSEPYSDSWLISAVTETAAIRFFIRSGPMQQRIEP